MHDPLARMTLKILTEKPAGDEFNREIVVLIFPQGYPFYPRRHYSNFPRSLFSLINMQEMDHFVWFCLLNGSIL